MASLDSASSVETQRIVDRLEEALQSEQTVPDTDLLQMLQQLKTLSRDVKTAGPLYTQKSITTVCSHATDQSRPRSVSRAALGCVANACLLNESTRMLLGQSDILSRLINHLDERGLNLDGPGDDEFLCFRIVLLCTYEPSIRFGHIVKTTPLAKIVVRTVTQFVDTHAGRNDGAVRLSQAAVMALVECVKVVFNISHLHPPVSADFEPVIRPLLSFISQFEPVNSADPLEQPVASVLNCLMELLDNAGPTAETIDAIPAVSPSVPLSALDKIVSLVGQCLPVGGEPSKSSLSPDLDQSLSVIFSILARSFDLVSSENTKTMLRNKLLPSDEERDKPLGQSGSTASKILNLTLSPSTVSASNAGMHLLYVLSHQDAAEFVSNVGYGFAAGYMAQNGIAVPAVSESADSKDGRGPGVAINPVTGQRIDAEAANEVRLPPMTEEEKEREAERMFVLFERLRATGVVDVGDPLRQAVESGRFAELEDSASEDSECDGKKKGTD